MKAKTLSAITLLLCAVGSYPSIAQNGGNPAFQAFIGSDFYKGLMGRAIAGLPRTVFQRCPGLVSSGSHITMLKPVTFAADGFPNAGMWKQEIPVSGCGNDTVLNFYFTARADEKVNTIIGDPGTTRGDPTLQHDTFIYATAGAIAAVRDCKSFVVKNTKFEHFGTEGIVSEAPDPGAGQALRPWTETWTMVGCGHTVDVPIAYVPDAKGTRVVSRGGNLLQ